MRQEILDLLKHRDYVSFAELTREIPGFSGGNNDHYALSLAEYNHVFWGGMSKEAVDTLNDLLTQKAIHLCPAGRLIYLIDGISMQLPVVKSRTKYKTPHWAPVTVRLGPYRKEDYRKQMRREKR